MLLERPGDVVLRQKFRRLWPNDTVVEFESGISSPSAACISVIAVWHITDHYGQLVAYLRLNGIVPPFTQKYGMKVR